MTRTGRKRDASFKQSSSNIFCLVIFDDVYPLCDCVPSPDCLRVMASSVTVPTHHSHNNGMSFFKTRVRTCKRNIQNKYYGYNLGLHIHIQSYIDFFWNLLVILWNTYHNESRVILESIIILLDRIDYTFTCGERERVTSRRTCDNASLLERARIDC